MSTRAQIAIEVRPGEWAHTYVHYDGYPGHMLPALAHWKPEDGETIPKRRLDQPALAISRGAKGWDWGEGLPPGRHGRCRRTPFERGEPLGRPLRGRVQTGFPGRVEGRGRGLRRLSRRSPRWPDRTAPPAKAAPALSNTFYHCRLYPNAPVSYRVYLNVHPQFTATVFGLLVAKWPTVFKAIVSNIKAAPPSRRLRADSVILYVDGPMAVEAFGVFLTRYQETHQGYFAHGIPRMTKPLGNLVGVGYGAEPTRHLEIHGDGSVSILKDEVGSFGSLRSELIALALCATLNAGEDKRNFVRRVSQHLQAADIDPSAPWEQRA